MLEPERAFTILAKSTELERNGKSIIHFEIGEPNFKTPKHVSDAAIAAIRAGKTKYTPSLGTHALREKLAEFMTTSTGVNTRLTEVAVTPGCKNSLFVALAAIIEPGDEVVYPDPGFPAYVSLIKFFGGRPRPIPLVEERSFSFDIKKLRKIFTRKTKAIILNSPGNPTGTIIPKKDLEELANLTDGTDTWIVTDEIYSQIIYDNKPFVSIYSLPHMKKRTIIANGFSKNYAMTGWRFGFLIFPENIMERIDLLLNNSVSCTASFTQDAALMALTGSQEVVKKMVEEYQERRDFVVSSLNEIKGVTCLVPSGAFYAFPNIKAFKKSSQNLASYLLDEAGVALLDGTAFGKYGEGYLRISYATDLKNIREGIGRIKYALEKLL